MWDGDSKLLNLTPPPFPYILITLQISCQQHSLQPFSIVYQYNCIDLLINLMYYSDHYTDINLIKDI